ncbi:cupin domain-containing protein [Candidatus Pacearchaeota archaeon]|nr:cupin domain-containing protein [Candidatus Pacearchaeota archaeon]
MNFYFSNIEKETLKNKNYRKVLFTGAKMQLVVMNLKPGEDIPSEVHKTIDQFIRIEEGEALVRINEKEISLKDDDIVIIPAGNQHYVKNTSSDRNLKFYTIYSPPEHAPGTIHATKADAEAAEHEH